MTQEVLKLALEALEKVSTRAVIMGSTGDYREGQLDALNAVSEDVAPAITAIKEALAQPEQNFCSRCGKRLGGINNIHTCTPPMEKNT